MAALSAKRSREFINKATSQAEEDAYDPVQYRTDCKFTSLTGSIGHIVKAALGGGILTGHVAYMKAGIYAAIPLNIVFGVYMGYCLYLLVESAQIIYKRAYIPYLSYSDVGEATCLMCSFPSFRKFARPARYTIDVLISLELFGACCCYQIIIAKTLKQLIENTYVTKMEGSYEGYPGLRVYIALMMPLVIAICLIRHLKYLAPFSLLGNFVIVLCIITAISYAFEFNPGFKDMVGFTTPFETFEMIGMTVFGMSCVGIVIPVENNMRHPKMFPCAMATGMSLIVLCLCSLSFFGYAAFGEYCESPITMNFPMRLWPKILKGTIGVMVYVTHALNFWAPFNMWFYYIKKKFSAERVVFWELVWRAIFVTVIGILAILFPDINALMGFIGTFCLSNMAFIWPNVINLLLVWERPGLGKYYWRLWRSIILIIIGVFIFVCGTLVNGTVLVNVFMNLIN